MLKTITCGELRKGNVGQTVTLAGWVNRRRDHGGLIFIDLRDHFGLTQVVFNPSVSPQAHALATELRPEYVVQVTGEVEERPAGQENPGLATGDIEVLAREAHILNDSKQTPFLIHVEENVDEALRLRYR